MSKREISGYRFRLPDRQEVIASLSRLLDAKSAYHLWSQACEALRLPIGREELELEELQRLANWFMQQDSLAKLVGCSLNVRLIAFSQLSLRSEDLGGQHE
jgi:hypothetical protein